MGSTLHNPYLRPASESKVLSISLLYATYKRGKHAHMGPKSQSITVKPTHLFNKHRGSGEALQRPLGQGPSLLDRRTTRWGSTVPSTSPRPSLILTTRKVHNFMTGNGGSETLSDLFEVTQPLSARPLKAFFSRVQRTSQNVFSVEFPRENYGCHSTYWVLTHDIKWPNINDFLFFISSLIILYNHRMSEGKKKKR